MAAAIAASTVLTSLVAVPMGITAVEATSEAAELAAPIDVSDPRFPEPVDLSSSQLAGAPDATPTDQPTATPDATVAPATPAPSVDDHGNDTDNDDAELAIVIPTPTPTPLPTTATPSPPSAPSTPEPEPSPTSEPATPTPTPRPTDPPPPTPTTPPAPTPTDVPTAQPTPPPAEPTPTPPVLTATDVYAYVRTEDRLRENRPGDILVKAVNDGDETTSDVVIQISITGGEVLSLTPDPAGWSCTGSGSQWVCRGPRLPGQEIGRNVVTVMPGSENIVVSVSISHALVDPEPDNNSTTQILRVRHHRDDNDDRGDDDRD